MSGVLALVRREFASTFLVPTGWIILAGWGMLTALIFAFVTLREGEPATLRAVVSIAGWAIAVVSPAISMRSFAEEARLGTLEVLLTSPLSAFELVMGKFLAAVCVLLVLALPMVALFLVAEVYGDPDPGEFASGLLGLLLAGSTLLALGMLISTRTSSQVVAYLLTFFGFFAVVLVAKGVPAIVNILPPDLLSPETTLAWIDWSAGLDPLRRLDEFAIGLFDSANVAWFLAATCFFLVVASISLASPRWVRPGSFLRRQAAHFRTLMVVLGVGVAAAAVSVLFEAPPLRAEADLTKTRAYSLQPTTVELLESLEPGWTVRLLVAKDDADPVTMRQVDEVVARMDSITPNLVAERIDPVDPKSIGRYEAVLEALLESDAATIAIWDARIERAMDAFQRLQEVGRGVTPDALKLVASLPESSPIRGLVERTGLVFGTLADQGDAFTDYLRVALQSTARQPLPNWRLVRASLEANNAQQAGEIEQLADVLRRWEIDPSIPVEARDWAAGVLPGIESIAIELRASSDALSTLESTHPLDAAIVAESIAAGDVAIVDGPAGTTVIPGWQLFPASAVREGGEGTVVGFDRRFQGEETLVSAIRALRIGDMPQVVFVHSEDRSLLRDRDDGLEVAGVANALRTARFEVAEWIPGRTDRPAVDPRRRTVWFISPPLQRSGLEYDENEQALLDATAALIAEGEPVLLTVARSMLPLVGKPDPWSAVAASLGVEVDTGRVVFEWIPDAGEGASVRTWQAIDRHPDAVAGPGGEVLESLRGKRLFVSHATPILLDESMNGSAVVLSAIRPNPLRWIEDDWRGDGVRIERMPGDGRFEDAVPVAVAVERFGVDGLQRLMVVGAGGWALSALVNEAGSLGGDRMVLANPGNRELAISGVAWLAGLDELVATASSGREVARFSGVTDAVRVGWGFGLFVVLALGPLLLGTIVWSARRATT